MSTKATNITQQSDGQSRILSGKGSTYQESGAAGRDLIITSKGLDLTNATTGAITFGETGVSEVFSKTVKDLFAMNSAAAQPAWTASPPDLNSSNGAPSSGFTVPEWLKSPWVLGGAAVLLVGALLFFRKS